ncbi:MULTISPECIES: hypothetical protein [Saccharibacillus]|uniref:hypothetical protein n=1 Tax=Saccharibacillus TaxID=456492 RepID=UPI00123B06AB|nr:hypothetical protein [Saccharibacillus sp. WB 17]MWJ31799.1 hypothetical protein [Saccharibacillus sp. WB 17]
MFKRKLAPAALAVAIAFSLTGAVPSTHAAAPVLSAGPSAASVESDVLVGELASAASASPARAQETLNRELAVSADAFERLQPEAASLADGKGLVVFCASMALSLALMFGVFGLSNLRKNGRRSR